jgi:pyruvate/2-oxoglutarate dehydrogenase complex dihydrolipoamide dehydrogenase (E3) component
MGASSSRPVSGSPALIPAVGPDASALVALLRGGMTPSERTYRMKTYKNVLVGSEIVDFLVSQPFCGDREHAAALGQSLVDLGALYHVTYEHPFRDGFYFYRLRSDDEAPENPRLNAAELRAVEYDLVVIGGGAAGLTAASTAAKLGARVALVEKARLGGDCTWSGCVPSKTLLSIAHRVHALRSIEGLASVEGVRVDMAAIRAKLQSVIQHIYAEEDPVAIARKGVDVFIGEAEFSRCEAPGCVPTNGIPVDVAFQFGFKSIFPAHCVGRSRAEKDLPPPSGVVQATVAAARSRAGESAETAGPHIRALAEESASSIADAAGVAASMAGEEAAATSPPSTAPSKSAEVYRRRITAGNVVIATGATFREPDIPGLSSVPYFTYESIWANDRLPKHLIVIGTGPVGCELAQAYSRLGAKVTVIGSRLLGKESSEAQDALGRVFSKEGIVFLRGRPSKVSRGGDAEDIHVEVGGSDVAGDMLLVATGRKANTSSLKLENIGVEPGPTGGIPVDDCLQTSHKRVFAAGDCCEGAQQFTHVAGKTGFVATRNALFFGLSSAEIPALPRVTFTDPEVAAVGMGLEEARAKLGESCTRYVRESHSIDRSVAEDDTEGYVSIVVHKDSGRLVGAEVVGARAGEIIAEATMAITHGLRVSDIAMTIHPYPTHSIGFHQVCSAAASELFKASTIGGVIHGVYQNARKTKSAPPPAPSES